MRPTEAQIDTVGKVNGQNSDQDGVGLAIWITWMLINAAAMWIYIETTKRHLITKMFQQIHKSVMPVWKRASSAMEGKLRTIHGVWFSAIPAVMTRSAREKELELNYLYN